MSLVSHTARQFIYSEDGPEKAIAYDDVWMILEITLWREKVVYQLSSIITRLQIPEKCKPCTCSHCVSAVILQNILVFSDGSSFQNQPPRHQSYFYKNILVFSDASAFQNRSSFSTIKHSIARSLPPYNLQLLENISSFTKTSILSLPEHPFSVALQDITVYSNHV